MNNLKNFAKAAFLFVALLAGTSAFAQQGQGGGQGARLTPAERAQAQLDRYQTQLELTADQTTKIKEILLTSAQELDKMRSAGTRPDRETMMAMNQKRNEQIKTLLTEAQKAKFDKMLAEQQNRMQNGGRNGQGGQGGNQQGQGAN